jgi:hypothetical protein
MERTYHNETAMSRKHVLLKKSFTRSLRAQRSNLAVHGDLKNEIAASRKALLAMTPGDFQQAERTRFY